MAIARLRRGSPWLGDCRGHLPLW
ncbi:hypothetical protein SEA_KUDEFRE_78 [Gordonia phage Kudefre]|uniref:Uncharacterized protein n=1 Tax=Gordonia phage Kudefre TaxID=2885975 RepID=A0AAE8Y6A7_9CAUD|nr:hypothetical protein L3Y24_gp078 [Gordonia phage Kudefre]UDL15367.1 hypothetical protein SEA_KUDEFRE_78 [Gordonia phage Kudefre]